MLRAAIGGAFVIALLSGCAAAATPDAGSTADAGDATTQAPAAPASCTALDLTADAVIPGAELSACITEVILERNTYHVVGEGADQLVTSDVRLDPMALHVAATGGDVYEVRGDEIHHTAGEDAPRESTLGYDGDDWEKLMLAQVLALVQSQQTVSWTQQLIAASEWRVVGPDTHADADGATRGALLLEATGPATMGGYSFADQRLWVADDFTLVACSGTATLEGFGGGASTQRFSRWGEPIDFPPVG